ncbi:NADH-quinone oxidoreductase subunit C [Streptomyces sp. NPDC052095]|uniref:NADH-quinone oxidoreductase subunit C n=1 Tax=unclassified Streptomyces TaxID=2593676 RepID=UPI00344E1EF1
MTTTPDDAYDRLPDAAAELFGEGATAEYAYELLTVDVPADGWITALETARDRLGCTYFDWLSAVDEPDTGFLVCAHVVALAGGRVRRLMVRTTVPHAAPVLPTAVGVYAGAAWHERETHEMFGIGFDGHPHLVPLLLPEGFEGHPLRKDFVLAARVAKAWPGAKEPGESEHGGPKRRTMLPPGVPDPNEWGPLKGQLPPAPARPARAARAAGDRPVRRTRSASEGSAAQRTAGATAPEATVPEAAAPSAPGAAVPGAAGEAPARPTRPRRNRSASQGSASQQNEPQQTEPRKGTPAKPDPGTGTAAPTDAGSPSDADAGTGSGAATSDAPWHHARPAFDPETPHEAAGKSEAAAAPEAAETAGAPAATGTPKAPEAPEAPETSETPEAPEVQETPELPKPPEHPKTPEHPEPPESAGGDPA